MINFIKSIGLVASLFLVFAITANAHGRKEKPMKKGILLVAFGTTIPKAQVALDNIYEEVEKAFPNTEIRWAYTSAMIREKLAKQGKHFDAPVVALSKMADDGYTHIAVQSLHTIPGEEYDYLVSTVKHSAQIPKGARKLTLGEPLLYAHTDIEKCVKALEAHFPERKKNEAIILMGHGTHHYANAFYPALNFYFNQSMDNVHVGTVEGFPMLDDILPKLKANKTKKVYLMPFMSVAGDHIVNDMAGDDDSWKVALEAEGFEVECIIKGTGEMDEVVTIWVDHLKHAFHHLED